MATMLISFQPKLRHALHVEPCRNCGRYLKTDRVKIHEIGCRAKSQKEIFASTAMEEAKLAQHCFTVDDRRKDFQNLMESIQRRGYSIDVSLPPPMIHSDYIQCLNCSRRFQSDAAYRHIPKCPDYEFNKLKPNILKRKIYSRKSRKSGK